MNAPMPRRVTEGNLVLITITVASVIGVTGWRRPNSARPAQHCCAPTSSRRLLLKVRVELAEPRASGQDSRSRTTVCGELPQADRQTVATVR
ncbi:hypothetical protein J6590_034150 [Homalodisca vitripennis]|nr:hypothetical protein J6590_034150 [Homalodisca vitripennis]